LFHRLKMMIKAASRHGRFLSCSHSNYAHGHPMQQQYQQQQQQTFLRSFSNNRKKHKIPGAGRIKRRGEENFNYFEAIQGQRDTTTIKKYTNNNHNNNKYATTKTTTQQRGGQHHHHESKEDVPAPFFFGWQPVAFLLIAPIIAWGAMFLTQSPEQRQRMKRSAFGSDDE
jgi:hypothetical protein